MAKIRTLPPRWANDSLSVFMGKAFSNTLATFVNKKTEYEPLVRVDDAFLIACQYQLDPPNLICALLSIRAHSGFRAACQLVMNGQIAESFPVLRTCLEYSLYALHIRRNPTLGEAWLKRHDDEETLKTVKQDFTIRKVIDTLKDEDQKLSEIGKIFNGMMVATFDMPQGRREELRELANRSEVSKDMMVHESEGKSVFGEKMPLKERGSVYEADKQDLMTETGQRLLAQFKVNGDEDEDKEMDETYIAEQMMINRLIAAKKGK